MMPFENDDKGHGFRTGLAGRTKAMLAVLAIVMLAMSCGPDKDEDDKRSGDSPAGPAQESGDGSAGQDREGEKSPDGAGSQESPIPDTASAGDAEDGADEEGEQPPGGLRQSLVFGAMGDSLTAGMNAAGFLVEARHLSWATGNAPDVAGGSHYVRFGSELGVTDIEAHNVAVSAQTSEGLAAQVDQLTAEPRMDYVTLQIGANDLCRWSASYDDDLAAFGDRVGTALDRLVESFPEVRIVISPIPDMVRLVELKGSDPHCRAVWSYAATLGLSCPDLLGSGVTPEGLAAFRTRWQAANSALGQAAARFPVNVHYSPALADTPFENRHISDNDCFHPSAAGQAFFAELTWEREFAAEALKQGEE